MRIFRFLPQAREELFDEISYYGSVQEGLGVRFHKAVTEAVSRAVENPEHGAIKIQEYEALACEGLPIQHHLLSIPIPRAGQAFPKKHDLWS